MGIDIDSFSLSLFKIKAADPSDHAGHNNKGPFSMVRVTSVGSGVP